MSINMMTSAAASRPRSESPSMLLGAEYGAGRGATWHQTPPPFAVRGADLQQTPIFIRDRFIVAAKQGSPPRGVPR
jgi:hypothetical protein